MRQAADVTVYMGEFDSQPLVFAHLGDAMPGIDPGEVDVICKADPGPRLRHVFEVSTAEAIEDAMGLFTALVLIFPEAIRGSVILPDGTARLVCLGTFPGSRRRPG
ncbi:hypothetical protein [Tropicimonas sp. IMCC34011]|uniref:hypothetical protein n=1 Tax=Tropicimonas sp. IMCC34011 TaxID=2248759 RepID=UPI000E2752B5|nr:hypothetical protein [Tropicimonas sp. IMCC34011]